MEFTSQWRHKNHNIAKNCDISILFMVEARHLSLYTIVKIIKKDDV